MAVKGNSKTPNNFLKPKNIFHGVEHFSSVFFQVKSSDFLFKQKQHLEILALGFQGVTGMHHGFLSLVI